MTNPTNAPKNGIRPIGIAYQRVSKEEAATGSFTFETQTQRIREKLDQIYGRGKYDLKEFRDDGISGAYGPAPTGVERRTRPTLTHLVEELETGTYDFLIVYSLSRLFRSPRWFLQWLEDVIFPNGVTLISATEDLQLSSAEGKAMASMMAVFDGYFRDLVVKRNRDAAATRTELGYYLGQVGYGWAWEPLAEVPPHGRRRIRPVLEEGRWIIQMKDWYLSGWNLPRIAGELNRLGVPSASGKSKWTHAVVLQQIKKPVHAGLVPSRKGPLKGEHWDFRYYDPEVWEQLQLTRSQRKRWKTNTAKTATHLLNGLVVCGRCGDRLYISSPNSPYRSYRCNAGAAQGQRTCPTVTVRADALEAAVVAEIQRLAETAPMRELLVAEAERAAGEADAQLLAQQSSLRERVASLEQQFERWAGALARGTIGDEEYLKYRSTLLAEQADARRRLAEVEEQLENRARREAWVERVREAVLDFPRLWEHLNLDERRAVLTLLLEQLPVDRRGTTFTAKIKVHLLPEREVAVTIPTANQLREKPTGVQSLTPRHLAYLHHFHQGQSLHEIAKLMGVSHYTAGHFATQIRHRLGVKDLADAWQLAKGRIHAELPSLPLGRTAQCVRDDDAVPRLSPKLMEVFRLLVSGATTKEVAGITGLSETTVAGRRSRLLVRFQAKTIFEAAQKARLVGLL
jgi:site-specific DNA recombinase